MLPLVTFDEASIPCPGPGHRASWSYCKGQTLPAPSTITDRRCPLRFVTLSAGGFRGSRQCCNVRKPAWHWKDLGGAGHCQGGAATVHESTSATTDQRQSLEWSSTTQPAAQGFPPRQRPWPSLARIQARAWPHVRRQLNTFSLPGYITLPCLITSASFGSPRILIAPVSHLASNLAATALILQGQDSPLPARCFLPHRLRTGSSSLPGHRPYRLQPTDSTAFSSQPSQPASLDRGAHPTLLLLHRRRRHLETFARTQTSHSSTPNRLPPSASLLFPSPRFTTLQALVQPVISSRLE